MMSLKSILTKLDEVSSFQFDKELLDEECYGCDNYFYSDNEIECYDNLLVVFINGIGTSRYTLSDYTEDQLVQKIKKDFSL